MSLQEVILDKLIGSRTGGDLILIFLATIVVSAAWNVGMPVLADTMGWRVESKYLTGEDLKQVEQAHENMQAQISQNGTTAAAVAKQVEDLSETFALTQRGLYEEWIIAQQERVCNAPPGSDRTDLVLRLNRLKNDYEKLTGLQYPPTDCSSLSR